MLGGRGGVGHIKAGPILVVTTIKEMMMMATMAMIILEVEKMEMMINNLIVKIGEFEREMINSEIDQGNLKDRLIDYREISLGITILNEGDDLE